MQLNDLRSGLSLKGLEPGVIVSVIAVVHIGEGAVQVIYKVPIGTLRERLVTAADIGTLSVATVERPWSFDGDGETFKLTAEAKRIDLAFLFDPMMAVHTSNVDPLPHQITAVYESMLPRQPLRYVLADDPGAGKTIMAGLRKLAGTGGGFDGVHVFTPHADVPDDSALRLCFLPPEKYFTKSEARLATEEVVECVRNNGNKPRYRGNRLIFVAADQGALARLRDCIRTALAWASISDDVKDGRLNIDRLQEQQAKKEQQTAEEVLPRVARECYKWLLCPVMALPTDKQATVESFALNPSGSAYASEVERVCTENELIITTWSPVHLRTKLRELYWKTDRVAVGAMSFWEDTQRYL